MRAPPRRIVALGAALLAAATASAAFQPIERRDGEFELPRVRAGTITVPAAHRRGRITVILTLADAAACRVLALARGSSSTRRLNTSSRRRRVRRAAPSARSGPRRATLKRAIPEATVRRNYTVLLNGMAVELPATQLATAAKLSFARKLYPSFRYTLALNRSPGLIGAGTLAAAGGGTRRGDQDRGRRRRRRPRRTRSSTRTGFSYPAGFPKGGAKWTTPKVIVARAFLGAGADERSRLALDPRASFHGTHVAGIAAGNAGTTAPAGATIRQTTGLSGVAPRAQIGNYRIFNVPTPVGHVGNTPEIVAAFESAVRDGMDVINFSGGGPQTDPASDALVEAVGTSPRPASCPSSRPGTTATTTGSARPARPEPRRTRSRSRRSRTPTSSRPRSASRRRARPARSRTIPFVRTPRPHPGRLGEHRPDARRRRHDRRASTAPPVTAQPLRPARQPRRRRHPLPAGSLTGAIALVSRGACTFALKGGAREGGRRRSASSSSTTAPARRTGSRSQLAVPGGMIADLDGAALRSYLAGQRRPRPDPGRPRRRGDRHGPQRHRHELLLRPA